MRASARLVSQRGFASLADLTSALETRIGHDTVQEMSAQGFAVVDNLWDSDACAALRHEISTLYTAGVMRPNATHLVTKGRTELLEKKGIHEAEMHALSPGLAAAHAPLMKALSADRTLLTLLTIYRGSKRNDDLVSSVLKAQYNAGSGACFPMHTDTDEQLDSRRVTALFYLNQEWKPGDGGEVVLYPAPTQTITIAPLAGRCVLFSAPDTLHRVLPSAVPRWCFTVWCFARHAVPAGPSTQTATGPATLDALWSEHHLRKHLLKAVHRDTWAQSLRDAHPPSAGLTAALEALHNDVDVIMRLLERRFPGAGQLVEGLRASTKASQLHL